MAKARTRSLRNKKRRKTVEKFKAKRAALLEIIHDQQRLRRGRATTRAPSCRSCRATPRRCGCATAAR